MQPLSFDPRISKICSPLVISRRDRGTLVFPTDDEEEPIVLPREALVAFVLALLPELDTVPELLETGVLDRIGRFTSILASDFCFLKASACLSNALAFPFISACSVFEGAALIARIANSAASIANLRLSSGFGVRDIRASSAWYASSAPFAV